MRLEQQITHPRLLRKPVRADGSATRADAHGATGGSRFLDATLLDQERKLAILKALKAQRIGDTMGREIFVAAVEYQLTAFGHQLAREPAARPDPSLGLALHAAAERARDFETLLDGLPGPAQDALVARLATQDQTNQEEAQSSLGELRCEIAHLGRACRSAAAAAPAWSPTEIDLVSQLARAFDACFELAPTAAPDGVFATTLRVLAEETGLAIPDAPELLAQALTVVTRGSGR